MGQNGLANMVEQDKWHAYHTSMIVIVSNFIHVGIFKEPRFCHCVLFVIEEYSYWLVYYSLLCIDHFMYLITNHNKLIYGMIMEVGKSYVPLFS